MLGIFTMNASKLEPTLANRAAYYLGEARSAVDRVGPLLMLKLC
jgi:hypothetical protein